MLRKIGIALTAVLLLAGCSKGSLELSVTDDSRAEVILENTGKDSSASAGSIHVSEEERVVIAPDLSKGEINIMLKDAAGNIGLNEVISGKEAGDYEVSPGTYEVTVSTLSKSAGTIALTVETK